MALASPSLRLHLAFASSLPSLLLRVAAFASPSRRLQVAFASPSLRLRSAFASPSRAFASPPPSLRLRVAFAAPALRHRVAFASSSLTLRFAVAVSLSPSPCLSNDSRTSCCSVAGNTSKNTSAAHQRRVSGTSAAHQRLTSGYFLRGSALVPTGQPHVFINLNKRNSYRPCRDARFLVKNKPLMCR